MKKVLYAIVVFAIDHLDVYLSNSILLLQKCAIWLKLSVLKQGTIN